MEFHIPRHIELKFDELVVACYAFGRGLLEDEGSTLWEFKVLTMVCSYVSQKQLITEIVEICFLPPEFSVYIPMQDENDWFLLVVDLKSKEAIILQALYLDDRTSIGKKLSKQCNFRAPKLINWLFKIRCDDCRLETNSIRFSDRRPSVGLTPPMTSLLQDLLTKMWSSSASVYSSFVAAIKAA
ncbi:unnamed protein product [Linum tenue]|uniref:Ubiquitin-like protease family profile domain-containing protein n=1 Tax=Linum tenue TaxID=586396 RepID=A0AAV0LKC8_9ROSI|nr:unnamed protein product [Linum tenue]